MSDSNNKDEKESTVLSNEWMIRPCEVYDEEYSDCTAFKSRFHQYFIHGVTEDCTQWKHDYNNCVKWVENKDVKAATELIESENRRRFNRLKTHYGNTTWEKRQSPPEDWNKPLPEHMQKEYEYTYLNIKSKEMKGEIDPVIDSKCSIM